MITLGAVTIHCEMDRDTEGLSQVRSQLDVYREAGAYNVWFVPTKARLDAIARLGTDDSLFSLCGSNVWINALGEEINPRSLREFCDNHRG